MIIPLDPSSSTSHTTSYRIKRGTKVSDVHPQRDDPVPGLASLDGPFQLSEYLALKIKHDPHDIKGLIEVPRGEEKDGKESQDQNIWIYEHLRRLPIDLTPLLNSLTMSCTKETCPEMKADQWLYFCSAHSATSECCAIDYILHTVDSTIALLNSSQQFPSRLVIPRASYTHFPSIFRRLSRIFSHAYFHHREAFALSESETSLYARFVALCEKFELIGQHLFIIPREAVGQFAKGSTFDDSEEEESEESEESEGSEEDDEDEDDEGSEGDDRGRGDKNVEGKGGQRTRSLDRHPHSTVKSPDIPRGPKAGSSISPPSKSEAAEVIPEESDEAQDPFRSDSTPFGSTPPVNTEVIGTSAETSPGPSSGEDRPTMKLPSRQKFGTLGRGKQSRGTMLWTSDESVLSDTATIKMPSVPDLPTTKPDTSAGEAGYAEGAELSRSESSQTAILIDNLEAPISTDEDGEHAEDDAEEGVDASKATEAVEDFGATPKDEIELLEEIGELPAISTEPTETTNSSSPTDPTKVEEEASAKDDSEVLTGESTEEEALAHGMEEVKLDDEAETGDQSKDLTSASAPADIHEPLDQDTEEVEDGKDKQDAEVPKNDA